MATQLRLVEYVQTGPDWLNQPDLREFLRRERLDDVTIESLGPRRSFAGKAWPHHSLIHLVSEGVHPIRWLLTLMHELAHVADYRQRRRDLESEWGRPLERNRHDGRALWRLDRQHGQRWRDEFVRLAKAAAEAGLFPGNEERVVEIAYNATTSLDDVALDLGGDPRVDAEELRRIDEQRHARVVQAMSDFAELKRQFPAGQAVYFDAGVQQGVLTGKLVRINHKSSTVSVRGVNWLVPHGQLHIGEAPPDARPAQHRPHPRERWAVGDGVRFRVNGQRYEGQIIRVNRKTCTVDTLEGRWRVAFSLLKPARRQKA